MRSLVSPLLCLAAIGCADVPLDDPPVAERAAAFGGPAYIHLANWLKGGFDTFAQRGQPQSETRVYSAIQAVRCRVRVHGIEEGIPLYIEQSEVFDPSPLTPPYHCPLQPYPGSPPPSSGCWVYYQRLQVVLPGEDVSTQARTTAYRLKNPSQALGWCDDPEGMELTLDDLIPVVGCDVDLTYDPDAGAFHGTMGEARTCVPIPGYFLTNVIEVDKRGFSSWDRWWRMSDGTQFLGPVYGPYVFDKWLDD